MNGSAILTSWYNVSSPSFTATIFVVLEHLPVNWLRCFNKSPDTIIMIIIFLCFLNGFVHMVLSPAICPLVCNRFSFHILLSQEISTCHLFNLIIFIKPESVLASHYANSYWRMNFDNIINFSSKSSQLTWDRLIPMYWTSKLYSNLPWNEQDCNT